MKRMQMLLLPALLLLLALAAGCDSGDETADPDGNLNETASATIAAADGGVVKTESGSAKIDIPAGALAEDTEITIATLATTDMPDADNLGSFVYDFGPDGTQFAKPVTLSLKHTGSVPENMKAVLAVLDGDSWSDIAGSALADGVVTGEVTHFSRYVVRYIDGGAEVVTEDDLCDELEFSACGGDVTGSWELKSWCFTFTSDDEENPFAKAGPECEDGVMGADIDWDGGIDFNSDGSWVMDITQYIESFMEIDDDCLALMGNHPDNPNPTSDPATVCELLGSDQVYGTCTYADGWCHCQGLQIGQPTEQKIEYSGSWATDGNEIALSQTGSEATDGFPYCVEDGQLVLQWYDDGDSLADYMILEPAE